MGSFLRATITDDNFIRGAARILVAPAGTTFPTTISSVVQLSATTANEVQTVTETGAPTGGTFRLAFRGYVTTAIAQAAIGAAVQTALEALPSVGTGNVTVAGAAGGPYTVTFQGSRAAENQPLLELAVNSLTGGTNPSVTIVQTTAGQGIYEPMGAWVDLGATKTGVQISRNNAEETFEVDQIAGDIASVPTNWEMSVQTALAEMTPETLDIVWQGGGVTYQDDGGSDGVTRRLPLGQPEYYVNRLLAIAHKRSNDKVRLHVFRKVQKSPQESTLAYQKQGEQQTAAIRFRCLADSSVADVDARFGEIIDQV